VLATLTVVDADRELPAASEAVAVRVWVPLLTLVESKLQL
jgi:hypothetical protein